VSARGLKLVALSVLLGGTAVLLSGCSWSEGASMVGTRGMGDAVVDALKRGTTKTTSITKG